MNIGESDFWFLNFWGWQFSHANTHSICMLTLKAHASEMHMCYMGAFAHACFFLNKAISVKGTRIGKLTFKTSDGKWICQYGQVLPLLFPSECDFPKARRSTFALQQQQFLCPGYYVPCVMKSTVTWPWRSSDRRFDDSTHMFSHMYFIDFSPASSQVVQ